MSFLAGLPGGFSMWWPPWKELTAYFPKSSTIPQLMAHAPLLQSAERSSSFITTWEGWGTSFGGTDIAVADVCMRKQKWSTFIHTSALQQKTTSVITVVVFACFKWKITPECKTSTKLNLQIQKKKEHNEVLDTHTGLCHREHHPFSAVDISEWGPEALHPQGSKQMKVYTAFCSSLPESHTIRPKLSFLAITPQSVFIVLGYRNVQIKARHKTRFRIGVSRSLGNGPQRANCLKLHYTAFVEMIMHLVYIWI